MIRRVIYLILLLTGAGAAATAQNQYVSVFNYRTMAVRPLANVPGVTWVDEDNSAYDANHQRFFFQGGPNRALPWNLFVIDATSGAVLSNNTVPANHPGGQLLGLQYDNSVDTLYAIFYDVSGGVYFSWVDATTGSVYPKQAIPGFPGYSGSTYDSADHLYICSGGPQLITIDARTGNLVSSAIPSPTNIFDLVYDNANSTLYGISIASGTAIFDSISLPSAVVSPLTILPVHVFPQINAYTIDETAGNFIFVGALPSATSCVNYRLYTVNIHSATIIDSSLYPYAQDPSYPLDSNLIEFSFDNRRGTLYALNWRPTLQTIAPAITISAAANPACPGQSDLFTATLSNPQATNNYQWLLNDQPVGGNTPGYADANPMNGDSIRCILTATTTCGSTFVDTSGPVVLMVPMVPPASLRITASADTICSGDTVVFQAVSANGGNTPQYQWLIDGQPVGSDSNIFTSASLADGDSISCILQSGLTCSLPDTSGNEVIMTVRPVPELTMPPDTLIAIGQQVKLSPTIGGGVVTYQWQPPTGLNDPTAPDPVATPLKTTTYELTLSAGNGCAVSGKVTITVSTPLVMPNAFTPNGDGRNDYFRIPPSLSIQLSAFSIYDRWGQRVFVTSNAGEGWNGTIGGRAAPAGAYVWVIAYTDPFTGKRMVASGTVMLVR